jgi:hypothetical protein
MAIPQYYHAPGAALDCSTVTATGQYLSAVARLRRLDDEPVCNTGCTRQPIYEWADLILGRAATVNVGISTPLPA